MLKIRTYSDLTKLELFEDRFRYLELKGTVGERTFGFDRWMNQVLYKSKLWKDIRNHVIVRDNGCDLGVSGYEIYSGLLVHHMNPILLEDLQQGDNSVLDPEFLITTSLQTHNAIHYGDDSLLPRGPITRKTGDTTLW
jgi:hypothetical protein